MKKSIIAAGAASVALAAMPVVSTFAALSSVTDNISTFIDDGCSIADVTPTKNVNINVAPGGVGTSAAAASVTVTCNNNGWGVYAAGNGPTEGSMAKTSLVSKTGEDPSYNYEYIPTGTETSGTTSQWAFKVSTIDTTPTTASSSVAPVGDYGSWSAIPASETKIVAGSTSATATVNTQYQVYAALGQATGTYTGKVVYTVSKNS